MSIDHCGVYIDYIYILSIDYWCGKYISIDNGGVNIAVFTIRLSVTGTTARTKRQRCDERDVLRRRPGRSGQPG